VKTKSRDFPMFV